MKYSWARFVSLVASFALPSLVSAHEVYVLSPDVVQAAMLMAPFSEWETLLENAHEFAFFAFLGVLVVFVVFFVSISRFLENAVDPLLAKLPPFAPVISRVTIGLSFISAAYFGALFGPELPLVATFGVYASVVSILLAIIGIAHRVPCAYRGTRSTCVVHYRSCCTRLVHVHVP